MRDYEYLFATTLHQKLREKIIGKIFVKVTTDDALLIKIESLGGLEYKTYIENFSTRIFNGWSTDYAAYEVVNDYKKFVMDRYFT